MDTRSDINLSNHVHAMTKVLQLLVRVPAFGLVIVLFYPLVVAVNEIASRQSILHLLESLQREALMAKVGEVEALTSAATGGDPPKAANRPNLKTHEVRDLQALKNRLLTLSAVGAGHGTNGMLTQEIMAEVISRSSGWYATSFDASGHEPPKTKGAAFNAAWSFLEHALPFGRFRNDNLLAIAMTSAGFIGAFSAAYRKRKLDPRVDEKSASAILAMTGEALIVGCSSSLLTFLAIKGGKGVLFLEVNGAVAAVNPYSGTFTAFVAGLFTEKLFVLLNEIVNSASERLLSVARDPKPAQGTGSH